MIYPRIVITNFRKNQLRSFKISKSDSPGVKKYHFWRVEFTNYLDEESRSLENELSKNFKVNIKKVLRVCTDGCFGWAMGQRGNWTCTKI